MEKEHESYGMIDISRFTGGHCEFFGSDLYHNGGISIKINSAYVENKYNSEWFYQRDEIIEINMTHNQFVDAITSGMNTQGVPCTIKHINGNRIPQISHVSDKKEQFQNSMEETHVEYFKRINDIISMLDGNIGKRKSADIKHELEVLRSHIGSNTNFVMTCFNEETEKTITEAKHSISNYIDHKVHSLGIEGLKKELNISIDKE